MGYLIRMVVGLPKAAGIALLNPTLVSAEATLYRTFCRCNSTAHMRRKCPLGQRPQLLFIHSDI